MAARTTRTASARTRRALRVDGGRADRPGRSQPGNRVPSICQTARQSGKALQPRNGVRVGFRRWRTWTSPRRQAGQASPTRTATTVVAGARRPRRAESAPRGDSHRGRRAGSGRCGGRRSGPAGPGSSHGRAVLGGRSRSGVLGRVGLVPSPSVALVRRRKGQPVARQRAEMGKAHAGQGSPAPGYVLVPPGVSRGGSRRRVRMAA